MALATDPRQFVVPQLGTDRHGLDQITSAAVADSGRMWAEFDAGQEPSPEDAVALARERVSEALGTDVVAPFLGTNKTPNTSYNTMIADEARGLASSSMEYFERKPVHPFNFEQIRSFTSAIPAWRQHMLTAATAGDSIADALRPR